MHPTVSVIIPVYNVESFLKRSINSILSQTYSDFEIIAINDGSDDNSTDILEYYKKTESRCSVIHQENKGLSATRNVGIKHAKGKYIYFFDSDDMLAESALDYLVKMAENSESDIVCFSGYRIDENDQAVQYKNKYEKPTLFEPLSGADVFKKMMDSGTYSSTTPMYFFKKSFVEREGLVFPEGFIHEDEVFTTIALCSAKKVTSTPLRYYKYRIRQNSIMTREKGVQHIRGWTNACSEILKFANKEFHSKKTKKYLMKRANTLAKNASVIIDKLNINHEERIGLNQFLSNDEMKQLGIKLKLSQHFPHLYKYYRKFRLVDEY